MRPEQLRQALEALAVAIRSVEKLLDEIRTTHDPLATHIFVSRRHYRTMSDTKSGKRHRITAQLSFEKARKLGYRGECRDWAELLGAGS